MLGWAGCALVRGCEAPAHSSGTGQRPGGL